LNRRESNIPTFLYHQCYLLFQDAFILWDTYGYPIDLTEVCSSLVFISKFNQINLTIVCFSFLYG
jgi:hypothetical protein